MNIMTGYCTVYVTAANKDEAMAIARVVVAERLAACANVLPTMTSVYEWQGDVHEDAEAAVLLKTRAALFDELAARIRDLHRYDCPCIVAWPIVSGADDYLGWVRDQTTTTGQNRD